jgi:hypothetical protein
MRISLDAVVIGAGPNGLAAAITLAAAGRSVLLREAQATLGGGARTCALTLPGFLHDHCSAVHPLARESPFFRELPLQRFGLRWLGPARARGSSLRRRDGNPPRALPRGDLGPTRARRRALAEPLRCPRRPLALAAVHGLGPCAVAPRPPSAGALRALRAALGRGPRPWPLRGASGSRALRRAGDALRAPLGAPRQRGLRPRLGHRRARRGLAYPGGRSPVHRRRPGGTPAFPRRSHRGERPRRLASRPAPRPRRPVRSHPAPAPAGRGRRALPRRSTPAAPISLRRRRLQAGLGLGGPHPLAGAGLPPRRHRAPGRDARGDRRGRADPVGGGARIRGPSCSSPSPASSTPRARRRGATPPGPTATCRRDSRGARPAPSRRRSSDLRRVSPSGSSRARPSAPPSSSAKTRTSSGATWAAAPIPWISSFCDQPGASTPPRDPACSSVRPRRHRAGAFTECAAISRRSGRCVFSRRPEGPRPCTGFAFACTPS